MEQDELERYGVELRDVMLAVDVPPAKADIGAAVRVGKRRNHARTASIAALSVLVVVGGVVGYTTIAPRRAGPAVIGDAPSTPAPPAASATPPAGRCAPTVLAGLAGGQTRIVATDPSGRYFIGYRLVDASTSVVLWVDGQPRDLAFAGVPVAVNAAGVIVGYSGEDDTATAWIYQDGKVTSLPKPAGYGGTNVTALNAAGDVVGWAMKGALDVNVPLMWPADQPGTVRKLSAPNGIGDRSISSMRATGIGEDRTAVGWVRGAPVRWSPDGAAHGLQLPAGYDFGFPQHLRGRYAYGTVGRSGLGSQPAVRWNLDTGQATVVLEGSHQVIDGTPAGATLLVSDPKSTAELVDPDGTRTPLLAPERTGSVFAWSISDDGKTIVGTVGQEGTTPVVWHCLH